MPLMSYDEMVAEADHIHTEQPIDLGGLGTDGDGNTIIRYATLDEGWTVRQTVQYDFPHHRSDGVVHTTVIRNIGTPEQWEASQGWVPFDAWWNEEQAALHGLRGALFWVERLGYRSPRLTAYGNLNT